VGAVVRLKAASQRALPRLVLVLGVLAACATPDAALEERTYAPPGAALQRVAVIPFDPHRSYEGSRLLGGVPQDVAAERVTRLVADALAERGIAVVSPDEVAEAVADVPRVTSAIDALVFAELAGRELGATAVLMGEVLRFRDVRGASPASRRPASVAYQVTLYEAPEGFKLWTARFDHTQVVMPVDEWPEVSSGQLNERWLSADEIAQRGAEAVARSLAASL
jgi:hypothetical protein